jgi:amino acid transporter
LVFYVGGVFCISLLISSDDPELFVANKASASAAASPFVVAVRQLGVQVLPSIINAAILIFTLSAANSDLYIASRTLYALAEEGHAPHIFTKVNRWGCPYYSLGITWLFCGLAYLRVSSDGATVFGYFVRFLLLFRKAIIDSSLCSRSTLSRCSEV